MISSRLFLWTVAAPLRPVAKAQRLCDRSQGANREWPSLPPSLPFLLLLLLLLLLLSRLLFLFTRRQAAGSRRRRRRRRFRFDAAAFSSTPRVDAGRTRSRRSCLFRNFVIRVRVSGSIFLGRAAFHLMFITRHLTLTAGRPINIVVVLVFSSSSLHFERSISLDVQRCLLRRNTFSVG